MSLDPDHRKHCPRDRDLPVAIELGTPPCTFQSPRHCSTNMVSDADAALVNRFGTIGIGYLGVVATSMRVTLICFEAFRYFRSPRSRRDASWVKYLVSVLWVLDTIQEAFAVHVFYFFLVDGFANPASIDVSVWSIPAGILTNAFVQLLVKTFYAIRIFKISGNYYVTGAIGALNIARFVLNVYWPAFFFSRSGTLLRAEIVYELRYIGSTGLGMEAATGILISACGVFQLVKRRSELRSRANDVISRLVALTVATGSLSALVVIADFVSYIIAPTIFYVLFFNMLVAKLDINALLTSLNYRDHILQVEGHTTAISLSMPVFVRNGTELYCAENGSAHPPNAILDKDLEGGLS